MFTVVVLLQTPHLEGNNFYSKKEKSDFSEKEIMIEMSFLCQLHL